MRKTLYRAGRQLIKVRLMMFLTLLCAIGGVWWGIDLARTYGLSPGDGGVLKPLSTRLVVGAIVALLGIGFAAGMWFYGRCYVAKVELDTDANLIYLYTVTFLGNSRHRYDLKEIEGLVSPKSSVINAANLLGEVRGLSVNAPWQNIRIAGKRLPLILDEQGEVTDPEMLKALFSARKPRSVRRSQGQVSRKWYAKKKNRLG